MKKYLWLVSWLLLMFVSMHVFAAPNDFGVSIIVKNEIVLFGIPNPLARMWVNYQDTKGHIQQVYVDDLDNSHNSIVINSDDFKVLHVTGIWSGGVMIMGRHDYHEKITVRVCSNWFGGNMHIE